MEENQSGSWVPTELPEAILLPKEGGGAHLTMTSTCNITQFYEVGVWGQSQVLDVNSRHLLQYNFISSHHSNQERKIKGIQIGIEEVRLLLISGDMILSWDNNLYNSCKNFNTVYVKDMWFWNVGLFPNWQYFLLCILKVALTLTWLVGFCSIFFMDYICLQYVTENIWSLLLCHIGEVFNLIKKCNDECR